ncbi:MAG: hypothetical protein KC502_16470 [Myxococcales bacterium]|nr:hypothetical protein [Myxococcales bacterium]
MADAKKTTAAKPAPKAAKPAAKAKKPAAKPAAKKAKAAPKAAPKAEVKIDKAPKAARKQAEKKTKPKKATLKDLRAAANVALGDGALRADILLADDPAEMFEAWLISHNGLRLKKSHKKEIRDQRDVLLYDLDAMLIGRLHQFLRDF